MKNLIKNFVILLTIFSLTACASYRPIFDQNEKYLAVGEERAQQDFAFCQKAADKYLDKYKAERAAKEAGRNAVVGGVVGAATGLIFGNKGLKSGLAGGLIGAGVGAAIGALSVAGEDKVKPDHIKQRYVSNCLAQNGYSVLGWR
jgi:hypothetical protein